MLEILSCCSTFEFKISTLFLYSNLILSRLFLVTSNSLSKIEVIFLRTFENELLSMIFFEIRDEWLSNKSLLTILSLSHFWNSFSLSVMLTSSLEIIPFR